MKQVKSVTALLFLIHCYSTNARVERLGGEVIATTTYGQVRGFPVYVIDGTGAGKKAGVFLGIPFAKPPVGELRLEKPAAPKRWEGVRDATKFAPACFPHHASALMEQLGMENATNSENCLYLNVFSPERKDSEGLLPVLVYIHGGGFEVGSAVDFGYESFVENFVSRDIVVVTIQYRLGPLGFAASGDESFAGNYGLWDQRAALKFLNKNIEQFGGDLKRITLWGHSAGAASVAALTVSTLTRDLFSQAIEMSGSLFAEWATSNRVIQETEKLSTALNCDLQNSKKMKQCLRGKAVHEILDAMETIGPARKEANCIKFGPRLDADFFVDDFPGLIASAPKKNTLIGVTDSETIIFTLHGDSTSLHNLNIEKKDFTEFGRKSFDHFVGEAVVTKQAFGAKRKSAKKEIVDFYLGGRAEMEDDHAFYLEKYSELLSDLMFVVPTFIETLHKTNAKWPVFFYSTEYFDKHTHPEDIPVRGSYHSIEYPYLFGIPIPYVPGKAVSISAEGAEFKKHLVESFAQFAKTGDPSFGATKWPRLKPDSPLRYMRLDEKEPKVMEAFQAAKFKFWQEMRKKYEFDIVRGFHRVSLKSRDEL